MIDKDGFFTEVKKDLQVNGWDNRKISTALRLLFLDLGVQLLFCYRLQVRLNGLSLIGRLLAKIIAYWAQLTTGCHISSFARLAGGIRIPHANGIVIGRDVIVDSEVSIYQQVTLGKGSSGKFPIVDKSVTIYTGAKIIGDVHLGASSIVGANSVVISDVDCDSIVAGVPARLIKKSS